MSPVLRVLLLLVFADGMVHRSMAQQLQNPPSRTKLVLDSAAFPLPETLNEAERIGVAVDALIPGVPPSVQSTGVAVTAQKLCPERGFPITVQGPRQSMEALGTALYGIRVYLCGITTSTGALDRVRFAFQLSHELAHVKMGADPDNYLQEMFAVAVSLETLKALHYQAYLDHFLDQSAASVPALWLLRSQPTPENMAYARLYWQLSLARLQTPDPSTRSWNYAAMAFGALLMQDSTTPINWPALLGISQWNIGPNLAHPGEVTTRLPDIPELTQRIPALCVMGYVCH